MRKSIRISLAAMTTIGKKVDAQQVSTTGIIRWIFVWLAMMLGILASCQTSQDPNIETWKVPLTDPVLAVGHGAILDAQGKEIDPSPEFAIEAQRFYLNALYKQANEKLQAEFRAKQQLLQAIQNLTQQEQILVNSALIAWLIDAVKPQDAAHLASKNGALRNRFFRITHEVQTIRKELVERLEEEGLIQFISATTAGGGDYINECRDAGVPIPPEWNDGSIVSVPTQWTRLGALRTELILERYEAVAYSFESQEPNGVCLALPRYEGDRIEALGIICLGRETSKACFWDNVNVTPDPDPANPDIYRQFRFSFDIRPGETVPLSRFAGGADLFGGNGVCSDCHAGQNPFIVHPRDTMDLGARLTATEWHEPLVHPRWPQNPGPTAVLEGISPGTPTSLCLGCHGRTPLGPGEPLRRFPEVSLALRDYCNVVLPGAATMTMPPGSPGNPAYASHVAALRAACTEPLRTFTPIRVVINGRTRSTPSSERTDTGGPLGACTGGDCPVGFCYWRTLHGPFWQRTDSSVPVGDLDYRGSFVRIYAESGLWRWRAFSDPTGGPPSAPPGGTAECMAYKDIYNVPDPNSCFSQPFAIVDPDGTRLSDSVDATVGGVTANVLAGFIGNVAQTRFGPDQLPDTLRVFEEAGTVLLVQRHSESPPPPLTVGPLTGEAWTNGCNAWTPNYVARDVYSDSDVQLVPYPQSRDVFCFITGITGAWSSTRSGGTQQPFAEIYSGTEDDLRLRVSPSASEDSVGAYASCIQFR